MMNGGCYLQAAATFQDAIHLMKAACRDDGLPDEEEIHAMIHKAVRKTVEPEKRMLSPGDVRILVVPDEPDSHSLEKATALLRSPTSVCFPVRIESQTQSICEKDPALITSLLLHNFGTTCVVRAHALTNSQARTRLLTNGYKIFNLCQTVLASRCQACQDQLQLKALFFLGIAVVCGILSCLPVGSSNEKELKRYQTKLARLSAGVIELDRSDIFKSTCDGAAAA